jgi:16S rRNA (adenine1518-N6/adenine1519-N6)-dimethyltransferase
MRLDMRAEAAVRCVDEGLLFRVIRGAFGMRRKTLANNLQAAFSLDKASALACVRAAGLREDVRAEVLSLEAFAGLADALADQNAVLPARK